MFLTKFLSIHDAFLPKKKIKVKSKDMQSPWITAGIKKSAKRKQRLYEKFLTYRSERTEDEHKNCKRLFETIKKLHFSKLIVKCKDNIKKTWSVIKEAIGKVKIQQKNLPKKDCIGNKEIRDLKTIGEKFYKFFTEIGPNLAKDIDFSSVTFDNYLKTFNANQPEHNNELKDPFFFLKFNKSPGYDEISFNVIKTCFGSLHKPLLDIFNQTLQSGIFPDKLKIARVTPLFKKESDSKLRNYRPISVLP